MALFDPKNVTAQQMAGLSNIPGQSLGATNTPQQLATAGADLSQGIQGTMTQPPAPVGPQIPQGLPTAPGSNTNFYNAISTFVSKANENKVLVDQKNLMLKQLFDSPLTPEEKAKLPASVQMDIEGGNSDLLKLNVSLINDQLQGRVNQTLTATKYLLQGYKDDQAAADKRMQESRQALTDQLQIGGSGAFSNLSPEGKRQIEKELGFANGFLDQKTLLEKKFEQDKADSDRQYKLEQYKASKSGSDGGLTTAQMNATINQIAGSFDNEAIVKQFNVINEGYNFAKGLSNTTKNPSDDQGLIYAFAKIMDPNSVVREGEYATVQKYSQSWAKAYGKGIEQAANGTGFLSTEARANIKKTLESRYQSSKVNYDNTAAQYNKRIEEVKSGGYNSLTDYSKAYDSGTNNKGIPGLGGGAPLVQGNVANGSSNNDPLGLR